MFEFKFPDVGEGITEGLLVKWLVKEGDAVKKEQNIAEVETDKAVVEIPSPVSGTILKLLYKEKDTVYVGKPLILIDDGSTNFVAPEQKMEVAKPNPMPSPVKYYDRPAERIAEQSRAVQTMQQSVQVSAQIMQTQDASQILALPMVRHYAKDHSIDISRIRGSGIGGRVTLQDLGSGSQIPRAQIISQMQDTLQNAQPKVPLPTVSQNIFSTSREVLATPSTRQFAREIGVDLSKISGTGDHGLITKEDVKTAATRNVNPNFAAAEIIPPRIIQGNEQATPMSPTRQAIFRKMSESWQNAVHVMVSDEADVTDLVALREKYKLLYEQKGIKLTFMAFFTKAVVLSLIKNPKLNTVADPQNKQIIFKNYYNIGIATDTEQGLKVPVVKNCESKNIIQLAQEINDLANRARNKTVKLDEMQGGTFTITNVGNVVGQVFTQIINYPESAILGIGRIIEKPIARNGGIAIRKMVSLSCTIDHRIIDGADASRFLKTLMDYLENPETMMLELV